MTDNNVINFPRIGFNLTPTTTLDTPVAPPPPASPPTVTATPGSSPSGGRRSPFDTLSALQDPGLTQTVIPSGNLPVPATGHIPDTFRGEPAGDLVGPRLGALGLAAILAVAVAALRGTHTVLTDWRQRRMARLAENYELRQARQKMQLAGEEADAKHALAMQSTRHKAAQRRAKIPSSSEFGRKTLGRTGGGGAASKGSKGAAGTGRSGGSSSSRTGGPVGKRSTGGSMPGGGSSSSRKNGNGNTKNPMSAHRNSQGAGGGLKKKPGSVSPDGGKSGSKKNGKGRTSLAGALTKDTSKAAARRLKRRRKTGLDKPALWGAGNSPAKKNSPANSQSPKKSKTANGKRKGNGKKANLTKNAGTSKAARTTLRKAMLGNAKKTAARQWKNAQKTAGRRWKKRQKAAQHKPPVWTSPKQTNTPKKKTKKHTPPGAKQKKNRSKTRRAWWAKARAYAQKKATQTGSQTGPRTGTQGSTPGSTSSPRGQGTGQRRSPFQNAGTATATQATTTVEWPGHEPEGQRPQRPGLPNDLHGLDAAPTPHTQRPGTTRPKTAIPMPPAAPKPDHRIKEHRRMAAHSPATRAVGQQMDAQHATEVTLDDACDTLEQLNQDAFTTHDECVRLADKARAMRDTWLLFAQDCATNHNLIGPLFTAASIRFAESMDLVARMADEMQTSSLEAAEKAETADNEMNDAYRPYTTATADAGLTTPSAPIHNRV